MSVLAPTRALDTAQLTGLVRGIAAAEHLWLPRLRFGTESRRWWTRLYGDDTVDVWLLTWLPGHTTDLHDHGASSAAYAVVQGRLDDIRVLGGGLSTTTLEPGEVTWVAPGVVHDVRSAGDEPAASPHVYSRPLEQMTYYTYGDGQLTATCTVSTDEPEQDL